MNRIVRTLHQYHVAILAYKREGYTTNEETIKIVKRYLEAGHIIELGTEYVSGRPNTEKQILWCQH